MAQTGEIRLFRGRKVDKSGSFIEAILRLIGCETVLRVTRMPSEPSEWEQFQTRVRGEDGDEDVVLRSESVILRRAGSDMETIGEKIPIANVPAIIGDDRYRYLIKPISKALGMTVEEAIKRDIPEAIRSHAMTSSPTISIGWHDIFECSEQKDGYLFGRAYFSFGFLGYGSPNDWKEYRRLVLQIPEIVEFKAKLELVTGPLEQCVYWNI